MSITRPGLDCIRQLIPNLAAAAVQTGVVTAAAATGIATGGVALPAGLAAVLVAGYIGLSYKDSKSKAIDDHKLKAALNLIRERTADTQQKLDALGLKLSHRLDRTHERLHEIRELAERAGAADVEILAYLRKHEGLFVSLGEFMEANFDELRPIITALPASIHELHEEMQRLHGELFVLVTAIKTDTEHLKAGVGGLRGDVSQLRELLQHHIESQKRPGVDPTAEPIPVPIRVAAEALMRSKDARDVALGAIAERQWDRADEALDTLRESPAIAEAFEIKALEGDRYYAAGMFDEAIPPYEAAFQLKPGHVPARNSLAIALSQARRDDVGTRLRRAIEIHEGTLKLVDPSGRDWAITQNNLGNAWLNLPTGDRAANLAKAIAAFTLALEVSTREAAPTHWAGMQNNLGNAWLNLPTGDRAANLKRAIAAYESALEFRTREAAPMEWAMTQNNLGTAWADLPTGDRAANLAKAIAAFTLALEVYTREAAPMHWAVTQNNLGNAWLNLPTGDRAANLKRAITAYESALEFRTREVAPMDWAMTQNNLGNAWLNLPTGDRAANREKAIAVYESALEVYTREAAPVEWAVTQNNLGIAWRTLPTGDRAANLAKAIAVYTLALEVNTREAAPMHWAMTQNNLGTAWADLPTGDRAANLEKAIAAFTLALEVNTRVVAPMHWAGTQNNLANALAGLAEQPGLGRCALLRRSIACGKAALAVRTPDAFPREHDATTKNLAINRARYEELGCHTGPSGIPFDDIKPAE